MKTERDLTFKALALRHPGPFLLLVATLYAHSSIGFAQRTAFSYQGRLQDGGTAASGFYEFRFALYDSLSLSTGLIAGPVTNLISVANDGLFNLTLDFGADAFPGADRWIEIAVRTNVNSSFVVLSPRQPVNPAPYALRAANFSGAVSDSQLSVNIARLNANQTFTGQNNFVNATGSFSGDGSGLILLNASQLASGTVTDERLSPNVALRYANQTFDGLNTFNGAVNFNSATVFKDVAVFQAAAVGNFSGDGSGLSSLDASQLASGTVPDGRLSANVALLNGSQTFTGQNTFGNSVVGGGLTLDASGASGGFNLKGADGIRSSLGLAASAGHYSSDAAVGDTVLRASAGNLLLQAGGAASAIAITSGNLVGIGTTTPDSSLTVNGSASKPGGGSWSSYSDARLKKNIHPLVGALDKLLALRGVNFEYVDPAKIHELSGERMGLIAQEVEKVFSDWVETGVDGYKRVTVRGLEALMVEALRQLRQEQQAIGKGNDAAIQAVNLTMEAQRAENANLKQRLERLEQVLNQKTKQP
jgi:hypothetical protein